MEKNKKLIIIGDGEFAEIAYEYFTHDSHYEVVGFAVEQDYIKKNQFLGLSVVPFEQISTIYSPTLYELFVAVTFIKLNRVRTRLYQQCKQQGYNMATYVSSKAFKWQSASLGENCFVFENNVIQHHVNIGNNVILWSGNHIGHHSVIADNCFISSHVVISGHCKIGENCFLGVNSTLVDGIEIEKDCMVAAGALMTKNTKTGEIYKGHPAKAAGKSALNYFNINDEKNVVALS